MEIFYIPSLRIRKHTFVGRLSLPLCTCFIICQQELVALWMEICYVPTQFHSVLQGSIPFFQPPPKSCRCPQGGGSCELRTLWIANCICLYHSLPPCTKSYALDNSLPPSINLYIINEWPLQVCRGGICHCLLLEFQYNL